MAGKLALNKLHQELAEKGFTQVNIYSYQMSNKFIMTHNHQQQEETLILKVKFLLLIELICHLADTFIPLD